MSPKGVPEAVIAAVSVEEHPIAPFLRMDRMPHIWCSTCGIGTAVKALAAALEKLDTDLDRVSIVSGIGCTGRVAGYVRLDSFHTTHGRPIPFATGLKLANSELTVIVFSGDGDLSAIGGNHFIHAARRNMDLKIICVNNFIYGMTGGQAAPTTPLTALTSTTPYGNADPPFNLCHLAAACGANYVARWTALHVRRLTKAFAEILVKPGFCFVEIITPCSTLYARRNRLGTGLDIMKYYHDNTVIEHGADPADTDIVFGGPIICGKFVERDRPTWLEYQDRHLGERLGDKYYRGNVLQGASER
jgi:2-oxoglutarate ferredoxin oxidoreductase subunit beta